MAGNDEGSEVGKTAGTVAGQLLNGILAVTPLGTLAFGVNEVLKRTGNGDQLGKLKGAVTDKAAELAGGAAKPTADGLSGVRIGTTVEDAQKRMIAEGQARMADLNTATGATVAAVRDGVASGSNVFSNFWDRLTGKTQDPSKVPVETRTPTPVSKANLPTDANLAEQPAVGPNDHTDAHSRHWTEAKVDTTVPIATAPASAVTVTSPVAQVPKLPPIQVLSVSKNAKPTDITKMLNENGLDRTQMGRTGPAIVNRTYYDNEGRPKELANAMQTEFRDARDALKIPDPAVKGPVPQFAAPPLPWGLDGGPGD